MQFLYLILSIYFGRKNPLFFLIFPLALLQGPGALIDSRTVLFGDDLFLLHKNINKDIIICYMILLVIYLQNRCNFKLLKKTPFKLYAVYVFFIIIITLINGVNELSTSLIRSFIYMILGYYLLLMIFSTVNYKQFIAFINMLFVVTGILSILYILNSSNILPVFNTKDLYQEIKSENSTFYRDFVTIPYFSHILFLLAFISILSKEHIFNQKAMALVLTTYPFVLLYTFTRSILITTVLEILLVVFITLIINKRFSIIKIFLIISTFFIIFIIIQKTFNKELIYFSERINSITNQVVEESNVDVRIAYHLGAYALLKNNNSLLIGDGLKGGDNISMDKIGSWTADSTIPYLLIYTGIIGVLFYYLIYFHFLIRTLKQLKKYFNPISLTLFVFILFEIINSFFMGGKNWGDPIFFINLVLVITVGNLYDRKVIKIQ